MTSVLTSRRQHVTWALGGLWLLDGLLQLQPSMFTSDFPKEILQPAGEGSPGWVSAPVAWSSALVEHHLVVLNALFALTQLALGIGIIARRTRKAALLASIGWAALVWWLGEGFGAMFAGPVSPLMGLPGAVALYALMAVFAWPVEGSLGRSVAAASPLHPVGAAVVWMSLWGLFAVETLMPDNRTPSGLHDLVAGMAGGEPGWVQSVNRLGAGVLDGHGAAASVALAVVFAVVAVGVLAPGRLSKPALVAAVALAVVIWVVGQDFGELATGHATDPNSGPLLALLAWCYWPASHSREPQPVRRTVKIPKRAHVRRGFHPPAPRSYQAAYGAQARAPWTPTGTPGRG
jgi:hypothetical protein